VTGARGVADGEAKGSCTTKHQRLLIQELQL